MNPTAKAFIGIDGGGSHTRALAIDIRTRSLATNTVDGCNPHNIGFLKAGDRINEAVCPTLKSIQTSGAELYSVFCGVAGIRSADERDALAKSLSRFQWARNATLHIDHDLSIAYEAALGDQYGICLIAGTGAACIAKDQTEKFHTSSNRLPDGDEPGSGFGIGKDALKSGIAVCSSESREAVSGLARSVIERAQGGDLQAHEILDRNTDALIQLVTRVHLIAGLRDAFPIVFTGGLGNAETLYRTLMLEKLSQQFPKAEIRHPQMSPVEAAANLALRFSQERTQKRR